MTDTADTGHKKRFFLSRIYRPDPAPPGIAKDHVVPQVTASFPSLLIFHWISPLLRVGFSRPLEKEDLWQLDEPRLASSVTDRLEENFYQRCPPELQPRLFKERHPVTVDKETTPASDAHSEKPGKVDDLEANGSPAPDSSAKDTASEETKKADEEEKTNAILIKAMNRTFFFQFWLAGFFQLVADITVAVTPLVTRRLIEFLAASYYHKRYPDLFPNYPHIGEGIGLAVGIFAMSTFASALTQHSLQKSMTIGMLAKGGLTGMIFRKALRLSNKSRTIHTGGKITTMISSDGKRVEEAASYAHFLWVGPIQLVVGIGLLIHTLGYSALVGLGVILIAFPVQGVFVWILFSRRQKAVAVMDKRVKLLQEIFHGIRVIKIFAWEDFFAEKVDKLRRAELRHVRIGSLATAALFASVGFAPIIAAILSFITYSLTGHSLDPAIIFTALQYFNIIRIPIILIPIVGSSVVEAIVALRRITPFLLAEELVEPYVLDPNSEFAIKAEGDYVWEREAPKDSKDDDKKDGDGKGKDSSEKKDKAKDKKDKAKKEKGKKKAKGKDDGKDEPSTSDEKGDAEKEAESPATPPFELKGVDIEIPKGSFVTIVGKVGSGKSSLVQAIIGEMRRTRGNAVLSGTVAYLPQIPWIMNASLRENITFGQEENDEKFNSVIRACQLEPDLAILPNGDKTEIGEKGISLSGGTKARVSLARAAYSGADIVILDDTLSAVDAHVGKAILEQCIISGPLSDKTRVMVTHALHVVPHSDFVFVIDEGKIVERGRYEDLIAAGGLFSKLIKEFGNDNKEQVNRNHVDTHKPGDKKASKDEEENKGIMQDEERNTGAVASSTYSKYLQSAGGLGWAPVFLVLLLLNEAANVSVNLFLAWWSSRTIQGFTDRDYMSVYGGIGVAQAVASFFACYCFSLAGLKASWSLFRAALKSVMRTPTSFFDTSPVGRVISRFSGDMDVMDSQLPFTAYSLATTFFAVFGTIFLVAYTFKLLWVMFFPLAIFYYFFSLFYRRTSVETKRLESILRSKLFAAYSEALTGLASVRASRREATFVKNVEHGIDLENRAMYMTVTLQRWLGLRLDLLGNTLVLGIALFGVGARNTVDPAKIGVVLSYSLMITWVLSEVVNQFAAVEQGMNTVERVQYYAEGLPQEAARETRDDPPPSWPSGGRISFKDVKLTYRPGLPRVLKGVSFDVLPGEKIGVVGRTGAGKSSLLQALFRIVEVEEGSIEIDGVDIKTIGLDALRKRLGVIPQDVKLFEGTIRENLDPLKARTDAELMDALRLASLAAPEAVLGADGPSSTNDTPRTGTSTPDAASRFTLEAKVENEGSNFSAGEGQLLAMSRALVKHTKVIVLDEATSSVDVETDAGIQAVIASSESTLLTIAHRLNTVAFYDRILVMDAGLVAEFDTPLALFDREPRAIFRSLCDEAGLTREDIVRIRARAQA